MGNEQSPIQQQKNGSCLDNNQLTYVMKVNTNKFGTVRIYRLNIQPYDYIMQYLHQHLKGEISFETQLNYYQKVPKHKNIVSLDCLRVETGKEMCVRLINLKVYCRYYNFTLLDAIDTKRHKIQKIKNQKLKNQKKLNEYQDICSLKNTQRLYNAPHQSIRLQSTHTQSRISTFCTPFVKFTEPDLWYVLSTLTSVAHIYQQTYNQQLAKIRPQTIFVSPQGYIKIYLLQNTRKLHENSLGCKTQVYEDSQEDGKLLENSKDSIFKFQQNDEVEMDLNEKKTHQYQIYCHPQKSDIFDIGLTLLCMINLDKFTDYFDIKNRPKMEFIHFSISNLDKKGISLDLQILLKGMVANIQQRFTTQKILSFVDDYRNFFEMRKMESGINYCLKLDSYENEDTNISQINTRSHLGINNSKISHNTLSVDRTQFMSGKVKLTSASKYKNLVAAPIKTMSSQIKLQQQFVKIPKLN